MRIGVRDAAGFWLNHPAQCAELFLDKEQGVVRTTQSVAVIAAGMGALRNVRTLLQLARENLTATWRWIVHREWMVYSVLLIVSCEFLPRIASQLASNIDLHLQGCAKTAIVATTSTDPVGPEQVLGVGESPDTFVRATWIAVALCAHYFLVLGCWRATAPFVWGFVFDDA